MKFLAFGPFQYQHQTDENTTLLFAEIEDAQAGLEHGVGVYLFAAQNAAGELTPWYVGLSAQKDFGARIVGHLNKDKFHDLLALGRGMQIYLLAAVDAAGVVLKSAKVTENERIEIRALESGFIGSAVRTNPDLLNVQGRQSQPATAMPMIFDEGSKHSKAASTIAKLLEISKI